MDLTTGCQLHLAWIRSGSRLRSPRRRVLQGLKLIDRQRIWMMKPHCQPNLTFPSHPSSIIMQQMSDLRRPNPVNTIHLEKMRYVLLFNGLSFVLSSIISLLSLCQMTATIPTRPLWLKNAMCPPLASINKVQNPWTKDPANHISQKGLLNKPDELALLACLILRMLVMMPLCWRVAIIPPSYLPFSHHQNLNTLQHSTVPSMPLKTHSMTLRRHCPGFSRFLEKLSNMFGPTSESCFIETTLYSILWVCLLTIAIRPGSIWYSGLSTCPWKTRQGPWCSESIYTELLLIPKIFVNRHCKLGPVVLQYPRKSNLLWDTGFPGRYMGFQRSKLPGTFLLPWFLFIWAFVLEALWFLERPHFDQCCHPLSSRLPKYGIWLQTTLGPVFASTHHCRSSLQFSQLF